VTPERIASLAAFAGERLHPDGASGPYPFGPDVPVHAPRAVYLVCGWSGRVLYVGSTTAGLRARFVQHIGDVPKTLDWATVYVIPLTDDTPTTDVRRIEGRIGLVARPERSRALPRLAPR
jgi:hypothetical protein